MKAQRSNWSILMATALLSLMAFVATGCSSSSTPPPPPTYTVTYDGNGSTGGSVPVDTAKYTAGSTVTVLGNTGTLVKTGFDFAGWNTLANATGTAHAPAATFAMGSANIMLYATWAATYTVTYDGNGSTGGSVPVDPAKYTTGSTVTVLGNTGTLVKAGFDFAGWNTLADATGTAHAPSATFAMGAANVTLYAAWTPIPPMKYFAYTANLSSGNVSAYTIDASTGALTAISGSPFAAGTLPNSVTVDPAGKFVYVANRNSNNVAGYTMDASTGVLTPMTGSPFSLGSMASPLPLSMTIDPTGKFAYVANSNTNNISAYTIDASTGALTTMTGSPFAAGMWPISITVDPTGKFVYVANNSSANVSAYTINASTGALTPVTGSPFALGTTATTLPLSVTIDPTGKFAYVTDYRSNGVWACSIDASTGALTVITGSPFAVVDYPYSVTIDPAGKFAYVTNNHAASISAYTIDASTGALAPMTGSPFTALSGCDSGAFDPTGKFVYFTAASSKVLAYSFNASTGALTPVTGSPYTAVGTNPVSIITVKRSQVPTSATPSTWDF